MKFGLDRLLESVDELRGRSYGLLSHQASVTSEYRLAHLALSAAGVRPERLFAPEHGFYGVEQDMVAALEASDPLSDLPIVSLYGKTEDTLRPRPEALSGLDLVVIDLQDAGARYYTFAATAVWTAEVALAAGCEVWILDRPNPLGGAVLEGNLPEPGFESFVSAFPNVIRHGLTLGELVLLEARRRAWPKDAVRVWTMEGWQRRALWSDLGRVWVAPSPNLMSFAACSVYPGGCLVEGTTLSEGRGTTRPFLLLGAPGLDVTALDLEALESPGIRLVPTFFRPQFQKHATEVCAGLELVVTNPEVVRSVDLFATLLATIARCCPEVFAWRDQPYEFVSDVPAVDLLGGGPGLRAAIEAGDVTDWLAACEPDLVGFSDDRRSVLLYD